MITPSFSLTATERVLPKLALDFTTASLDSRVTFTRTVDATHPATYVNSGGYITVATTDQPRFDYDPITLACKGLLIEESRSNLLFYSEQFGNAYYTKQRSSISVDAIASPDGNITADKLIEDTTASNTHEVFRQPTISSSTAYTFSAFVKAAERTWVFLNINNPGVADYRSWFNLATGVTGTVASGVTTTVTPFPNGWYRLAVTRTSSASQTSTVCSIGLSTGNNVATYTGDGTSGAYIWGAQLEAGAFATSYIPTTTTALTRNADVATMTGTNFSDWWAATTGGIVVRALPFTVSGTRPSIQFDDNTTDEIIALRGNTTNPELYVKATTDQATIDAGTIAANTAYNLGAAWNTDNCAASVNGGAVVTDTSATIPTVTQARLGSDGTNYLNGHLQTIRYWPQRINNAETQAFSK